MLHIGGADAHRQSRKSSVRGSVGIAADHGHAGQSRALFGSDYMDNALAHIAERIVFDTVQGTILGECF